MKIKFIILIFIILSVSLITYGSNAIKDSVGKELIVKDNFAGQSFTLIKEKSKYIVVRKFFGSGVPVIAEVRYKVVVNSENQILFSKIIKNDSHIKLVKNEVFILSCIKDEIDLYLNGLKLVVEERLN
ncbi:MAG: hypothetical protein N4A49_07745 [Marinifilaceae bacterium]|jgi:hypothetical protein|nr:hypothetical protein [Marinifilaceae bacterium]